VAQLYPYSAAQLGRLFGHGQNWAAAASYALDLKGHAEYWWGLPGARGGYVAQRYSEKARAMIQAKLDKEPEWNPYQARRNKSSGGTSQGP